MLTYDPAVRQLRALSRFMARQCTRIMQPPEGVYIGEFTESYWEGLSDTETKHVFMRDCVIETRR